jgi:hypothetical protein
MGAVCTSETSVYFNEATRRYIPAGCHLHGRNMFANRLPILFSDNVCVTLNTCTLLEDKLRIAVGLVDLPATCSFAPIT